MKKPFAPALVVGSLLLTACDQAATDATASEASAAAGAVSSATASSSGKVELETEMQKVSYSLGFELGERATADGVDIDVAAYTAGLNHGKAGEGRLMSAEEIQMTMTNFQQSRVAKMEQEATAAADQNRQEGAAFLAENKTKEGVQTTASGLQYKVITEGSGAKPSADDSVSVHYRGTLINGKEFDSSYSRGQPANFPVNGVISGWTEALQLMPVGSKWQLFIPAELAYGDRGAGGDIGPGATLLFDVELLEITTPGQ